MSGYDRSETAKSTSVSLLAPIAAPIRRSVDPVQVARFLKEREHYELEIKPKKANVPTLKTLPYGSSIDRTVVNSLVYMGELDELAPNADAVKDLADDQVQGYTESLVSRSDTATIEPAVIEHALFGFSVPTKILYADARATTYCADSLERFETVSCGSFHKDNPKKSIRLVCARLDPPILMKEMRKRLDYDETLEKSVKSFIEVLIREAVNCPAYGSAKHIHGNALDTKERSKYKVGDNDESNSVHIQAKKPLCLYPPHKEKSYQHLLKDCRVSSKEEKDKLFEELRALKKGGVKRTTELPRPHTQSSVVFSTTFGSKYTTTIAADTCAAATIMDSPTIEKLEDAEVDINMETVVNPDRFNMAARNADGSDSEIECTRGITIDTQLHIRHGSALVLRGLRWLVTTEEIGEPVLARPLLEALGIDCHKVSASTADRLGGTIDVSTLVGNKADSRSDRISSILDGVLHAGGGVDNTDPDDGNGWLDLKPEDPVKKKHILETKLQEASDRGISHRGRRELENLLREFTDVIKLKVDAGMLADINPLLIRLKPNVSPVRAKQRRYT